MYHAMNHAMNHNYVGKFTRRWPFADKKSNPLIHPEMKKNFIKKLSKKEPVVKFHQKYHAHILFVTKSWGGGIA